LVTGRVGGSLQLEFAARLRFFHHSSAISVQATLRNTSRAIHPGGLWDLGDPGSRFIKDWSFTLTLPSPVGGRAARVSAEVGQPAVPLGVPGELYQESSGGAQWQSRVHINRTGVVPLQMRGYRLRDASTEVRGLRATPVATVSDGTSQVSVAHRQFWQRFPKAIEITDDQLSLKLLPGQFPDLHELQGGEQITEEFVVCFGQDTVTEEPLEWVRSPLRVELGPDWYRRAEAMPYLGPRGGTDDPDYYALVDAAIEGDHAFDRKRERIDEYGWRHFGDLYADHENARNASAEPFISHYNNQYDAIAGFAAQYFRSGDERWRELMDDLARHVIDIDIYHTAEDKPAYNGGMFWHTAHYVDAGKSTHRTYPSTGAGGSGGPSAEHNYNTGLMLLYFMTGDVRARDAAIGLADWVIAMDDGTLTPLKWLSRWPTGLASATGTFTYHGPGRGPGNSVVSLLNACRLTGDAKYLRKAEELIRRCVHPEQDLEALDLLNAEVRWYYTVFLQALGGYLDFKAERGEQDPMYAYARATLLHYARWMVEHEYPYLDQPEKLEFPTETWAAQDIRKSVVLALASRYTVGAEVERFRERATFFFRYSVSTLRAMATSACARPLVLMLTNGYVYEGAIDAPPVEVAAIVPAAWTPHAVFVPQRQHVRRRAVYCGLIGGVVLTLLALRWLL
jgi:hypothetical protein